MRILFHCAHKQNDETKLMSYHARLGDSIEDQLSLAATHFARSHLQACMSSESLIPPLPSQRALHPLRLRPDHALERSPAVSASIVCLSSQPHRV